MQQPSLVQTALWFPPDQNRSNRRLTMITIKIMNEFMHGPIWTYNDGSFVVVDEESQRLHSL